MRVSVAGASAYVKVADGCRRPCAFCAIPLIKGTVVSRPVDVIIDEARRTDLDDGMRAVHGIEHFGAPIQRARPRRQRLPQTKRKLGFDAEAARATGRGGGRREARRRVQQHAGHDGRRQHGAAIEHGGLPAATTRLQLAQYGLLDGIGFIFVARCQRGRQRCNRGGLSAADGCQQDGSGFDVAGWHGAILAATRPCATGIDSPECAAIMKPALSVVIPVCNEELNVQPLASEIAAALRGTDIEILFIDDGSTDGTAAAVRDNYERLAAAINDLGYTAGTPTVEHTP